MKTLIYSPTGLTSKQIGLAVEVTEKLSLEGHDLCIVMCDNVLHNCYFNRTHNILGCASCQSRTHELLKLAKISKENLTTLKNYPEVEHVSIPLFNNVSELLNFEFEGIQVGRGVASSIISYKRDFYLTSEKYGELIEVELRKAINVLLNFQNLFTSFQPDQFYIFNGRFAEVFPALELAKRLKISFYTVEAGALSSSNYELFENGLPHSIRVRNEAIYKYWQSGSEPERSKIGNQWFTEKRQGLENYGTSFTKDQQKNLLPDNFNPDVSNIALFNSSEDEVKAILERQSSLYSSQNEAIENIVTSLKGDKNYHFYLRVHPNLGKVKNVQMEEINNMEFSNLTIIPPQSPIDTYHLIDACDKTITFGSTAGIEATFAGKPSILYGNALYMGLECVYIPKSLDQLIDLVKTTNLPSKDRSLAYPYGYYMSIFGTKTQFFKFRGLEKSTYKNHPLRKFYFSTFYFVFKYLQQYKIWKKLHKAYYSENLSLRNFLRYK